MKTSQWAEEEFSLPIHDLRVHFDRKVQRYQYPWQPNHLGVAKTDG